MPLLLVAVACTLSSPKTLYLLHKELCFLRSCQEDGNGA